MIPASWEEASRVAKEGLLDMEARRTRLAEREVAEMAGDKSLEGRVQEALRLAVEFGGYDGSHHKQWVIDQMVRALTGDQYEEWVERFNDGDEGPDTYLWEEGIAP